MSTIMTDIETFFHSGLGSAIKALLILILAFIVAAIARSLITNLLNRTKLAKVKSDGQNTGQNAINLIGRLVQLIVFLLFVPGIFDSLGMTSVSTPIVTMLNTVASYIPNVVASGVILWVGFYVARLVRELLVPVLNRLEVNRLQKIAGIEVTDEGRLSNTIAYIVYVLILIPFIIAALYVLNIRAITEPAISMLSVIFSYIPNLLAALVIITIGWILARFIGNIVTRLIAASGLDARIAELTGNKNPNWMLSNVVGRGVEIILIIFFAVESFSTLHLGVLTNIGVSIINYLPYALTAVLIFGIAVLIASISSKTIKDNGHPALALGIRYLIYTVAVFLILNQLGIATTLVDSTFIIIVAAVAVAFAIAFGVGGREFARNQLARLEVRIDAAEKEAAAAIDAQAKADAEKAENTADKK